MLANPGVAWQKIAEWGINQEKEAFMSSPDKVCLFF
jgi:hypothetical protein